MKNRVGSGKRSFKRRVLGALAIGSTSLVSGVAIAGVAATGIVLSLSSTNMRGGGAVLKWLEPALSVLTISSITAAGPVKQSDNGPIRDVVIVKKAAGTTGSNTVGNRMELGVNIAAPSYYGRDRSFMNLAAGGGWTLINAAGAWGNMPADHLDTDRNVVRLDNKEQVARPISIPTKALRGASVEVTCRWEGAASAIQMFGNVSKNVRVSRNSLTYTHVPRGFETPTFIYSKTDVNDPLRNIDCRESDADRSLVFDPAFIAEMQRYSTIRFMLWSKATNANYDVAWATRTKPGDGVYNAVDGVPIEYMVQLANEAQANPWFTIPWNADANYVRKMAEYVRDNLDPGLKAYVETGNEIWNAQFPVYAQALSEGRNKGLSTNDFQAVLNRYAQKTGEVMDVWSDVYTGQMSRLVRVAATQNSAWAANEVLRFRDTATKVDALATAPYFNNNPRAGVLLSAAAKDNYFTNTMVNVLDQAIAIAKDNKAVAAQYNLRYIAYEAGQHIVTDDLDQFIPVQRDPRMGRLYTRYLTQWQQEIGDLMVLFSDVGPISKYGAWGMQEYAGQPLNEAPKAQAVDLFRRSYLARK